MDTQCYAPGLFDRFVEDHSVAVPATRTLAHLKGAVARGRESPLNMRAAITEQMFARCPEASTSVLACGLVDFAPSSRR